MNFFEEAMSGMEAEFLPLLEDLPEAEADFLRNYAFGFGPEPESKDERVQQLAMGIRLLRTGTIVEGDPDEYHH